ncbi:hypothetical protein CDAR_19691 [Caerostris darwini]|uniref:Uncharacterized protein n=1 Tax=Caerostris darwini TaxID=1538125 RepID=A0AAV4QFI3_9ARAC|nr:hypothetical protein CDAR_19691 [Caerostris darwini]
MNLASGGRNCPEFPGLLSIPRELVNGKNLRTPEVLLYENCIKPHEIDSPAVEYVFELINNKPVFSKQFRTSLHRNEILKMVKRPHHKHKLKLS